MKQYEIWTAPSVSLSKTTPIHIVEADSFYVRDNAYIFVDSSNNNLHI
jgi:hypothetical protein